MSASTPERLTISLRRIVVLSAGLYYLHWVYRTWGQLAREAPGHGPYYPVWHALTLLVPVYAQFRMHRPQTSSARWSRSRSQSFG